ncbi:hypothetical protein, partial [Serratia marcescens]|uniref:hypothetical protein n=1 Tax=Serratia marcescens TaxID=615 RepID=UPI003D6D8B8F
FTAEIPAAGKGEVGKSPPGLCDSIREGKEWPVPQAPAFRSVRLLPRGADRSHRYQVAHGVGKKMPRGSHPDR